jgi:hypothetical protein
MNLKKLLPKFENSELEAQFRLEHCHNMNRSLQYMLPVVSLLCFGAGCIRLALGDTLENIFVQGLLLGSIFLAAGWSLTFLKFMTPYNQIICTSSSAILCVVINVRIVLLGIRPEPDTFNIILMLAVAILGLRVAHTIFLVGLSFISVFVVVGISGQFFNLLVPTLISIGMSMVILGLSFLIEGKRRKIFTTKIMIKNESEKANSLLEAIMPTQVKNLLESGTHAPRFLSSDSVIIFLEVTRFNESRITPGTLRDLDALFRKIDAEVSSGDFETIKTVGFDYLFAAGVLPGEDVIPENVFTTLFTIFQVASGEGWQIKAGVASGSTVSGVLGSRTLAFDVWGKPVNTAARLKHEARWGEILMPAGIASHLGISGDRQWQNIRGIGSMEIATHRFPGVKAA